MLSPEARDKKQQDIVRKTRERQAYLEDGQAEINRMRERAQQQAQAINGEFQQKVRPLVEMVAKDKGLDLVLDSQVAYTINRDFDITRDVIAKADEVEQGAEARGGRPRRPAGAQAAVAAACAQAAEVTTAGASALSSGEVGRLVRQIPTQYPFVLVDRILEHDAGGRLVATKNVTGTEDFFAGHFPGPAGDARRADPRVAGAGRRDLAAEDGSRPARRSRSAWSASTTPSSGGRWCRATSCGSR